MTESVDIESGQPIAAEELRHLYASVGWVAYTADVDALAKAVANSTYVATARSDGQLIGLARGMSDNVSIFYLQDILVQPDWQHRGTGRALLENCLERFHHVRQKVLLTDDDHAQHRFYEAMGYTDIGRISRRPLHAFVKIAGLELEG